MITFNKFSSNILPFKIKCKNYVQADRPHIKIWCMRIECWIILNINIISDYVIFTVFHGKYCCRTAHEHKHILRNFRGKNISKQRPYCSKLY